MSAFEHVYAIRRLGGAGVSATVPRRDWESCCVESRREPLNLDAKCWVDAAAIRLELRGDAANEPVRSRQRVGARAALLVTEGHRYAVAVLRHRIWRPAPEEQRQVIAIVAPCLGRGDNDRCIVEVHDENVGLHDADRCCRHAP